MPPKAFPDRVGISRKGAIVNIALVANAFVWYYYVSSFLMQAIKEAGFSDSEVLMIWGVNFLGIAIAAILGVFLIYRFKRRLSFLLYWMLAGVILSLSLIMVNVSKSTDLIMVSAVLGVYFGLGMPTCMGYYSAATKTANRARLGGITFLLIGLGSFLLGTIGIENTVFSALILAGWRAVGLVILFFLKPDEKQIDEKSKVSYHFAVSNRSFLLYFIPWCMFTIVNCLAVSGNSEFFSDAFIRNSILIENVLAGISAVIGGFFADFVGRKRLTVAGFALLGLGYAILGFLPGNLSGWWFFTFVDGIAWGAFVTIFLITVWGDLAHEQSSEKYYALGSLPFLFSNFLRLSLGSYVSAGIPEFAVFSFASFFLFLAVLPLVYAPETLPEKTMKDRELKKYIEKAQQEAAKAQKEEENTQRENEDAEIEFEVNQEDYEEALKEAEKYY